MANGTWDWRGWQLSGIFLYASPLPFNVQTGNDRNNDTTVNDRPAGVGRNSERGFNYASLDVRIGRRLAIGSHWTADVTLDAFNVLNRTNLLNPNGTFGTGAIPLPSFGRATAAGDPAAASDWAPLPVLGVLKVLKVFTVLTVLACCGLVAARPEAPAQVEPKVALIGVEGRDNRNPSIVSLNRFVALAWTATAGKTTDVFVSVSRDGAAFGAPRQVNDQPGDALAGGEQAPRVLLSPGFGSGDPRVAVVWASHLAGSAIRLARSSSDGGLTFTPAESVSPAGAPGHRGWPAATADPTTGSAHVVWLDHGNGSWLTSRSLSLGANRPRSDGPGRIAEGVCYCCKTAIAAGPRGALYAAWRHVYPGNIRDIAFVASRDGGRTFEKPLRVSDDRWQINGCPDDGPAMAVDRKGAIHRALTPPRRPPSGRPSSTRRRSMAWNILAEAGSARSGIVFASHPSIAAGDDGRIAIVWDERRDIGLVEMRDGRFSRPTSLDNASTDGLDPVAAYTSHRSVGWTS